MHRALTPPQCCSYGSTALRRAVWFGRKACVQLLLDGGADVNLRDVDSKTPLQHAEKRGHSEIAALLRAAGGTTDDAPPPPTPKTAPVGVEGEGETLYENVRQASVGVEGDGEALYENVQQPSSEKDGEGDALYENVRQVSGDVEGEGEALYENVGTGNVEKKVDPNTAELQAEVARLTAALAEQTEENEALRKKEKLWVPSPSSAPSFENVEFCESCALTCVLYLQVPGAERSFGAATQDYF